MRRLVAALAGTTKNTNQQNGYISLQQLIYVCLLLTAYEIWEKVVFYTCLSDRPLGRQTSQERQTKQQFFQQKPKINFSPPEDTLLKHFRQYDPMADYWSQASNASQFRRGTSHTIRQTDRCQELDGKGVTSERAGKSTSYITIGRKTSYVPLPSESGLLSHGRDRHCMAKYKGHILVFAGNN